jgi:hypothetical protein
MEMPGPQPGFAPLGKWKTKTRFPTFPPPLATMNLVLLKTQKTKKGSRPLRGLSFSYPSRHPVGRTDFMLIFQLENARCPVPLLSGATAGVSVSLPLVGSWVSASQHPGAREQA